ncbi:hypothetical protein SEA_ZENTENO07_1 [Mycobacterium phage Zenteno07]|nr:hypothetical protein SEA_ZENTENO07_1 [Mycobacterium phage Zenteno07]
MIASTDTAPTFGNSLATVYAVDMYAAQGFELTDDLRADMTRRAAMIRSLLRNNDAAHLAERPVDMHLTVRHPVTFELIGRLTYQF